MTSGTSPGPMSLSRGVPTGISLPSRSTSGVTTIEPAGTPVMGWDLGRLSLRNPAAVSIPAVTITIASLLDASIEFDPAQPTAQHAADELHTHLRAAAQGWTRDQQEADRGLSEAAQPQPRITLRAGAAFTDGFQISVTTREINIAGDSPRGALNGVYWLLEQLGFSWVRPG